MGGQHRVHGRHGFVGEQQLRLLVERPGDADALQLATGQLIAGGVEAIGEIQRRQGRRGAGAIQRMHQADQAARQRPLAETSGQHRSDDALARRQGRRLVDQADTGAQLTPRPVAQAPGLLAEQLQLTRERPQPGGQQAQQAGFARPGRTDQRDLLTLLQVEVEIGQGGRAVGVYQRHAPEGETHLSRPAARAEASMLL